MIRKTAFVVSAISTALALGVLPGCSVQMGTKPADAPPQPAPAAPAPAPAPAPVAAAPAAPPPKPMDPAKPTPGPSKVVQKGSALAMPGNIVFDTDKATLQAGSGSEVVLDELKRYLDENATRIAVLRIEGHTDNQGTPDANLALSGARALTIKQWLVTNGIAATRLLAVGFGQTKPIAPNTTEEGRAQNRRTEFHLAETYDKSGKPTKYLGGDPLGGGKEFK